MTPPDAGAQLLFSYGTLQHRDVQLATFGHALTGTADAIVGYAVSELVITDAEVIARSGSDRHPILIAAEPSARVEGTVYSMSPADLAAADDYEVDDYTRVQVTLASGSTAWVYAFGTASD